MTVITNKRTVILLILLLAIVLLYFGYRQDSPRSAEKETAALLRQMSTGETEGSQAETETKETIGTSLPEVSSMEKEFFQEAVKQDLPQKSGVEFFVNYRLERDRIRSMEVEMLQQIVDNPNSVAETREEAQNLIIDISRKMEQEMQLENLISAKGYDDAAVFVDKDAVTVIVFIPSLAEQDVTRIADLVARVTSKDMQDVFIIPKA